MTKQDYKDFASLLYRIKNEHGESIRWTILMSMIAELFKRDNAQFDRERFYLACEHNIIVNKVRTVNI